MGPGPSGTGGVIVGFNRVLAVALFLAAVLASLVALFIYNHAASLADARRLVGHTHLVIEKNHQLLALVEDAMTSLGSSWSRRSP